MICSNCKHEITPGAKFCGSCGAALIPGPAPQSPKNSLNQEPQSITGQSGFVSAGVPMQQQASMQAATNSFEPLVQQNTNLGMFGRRMNGLGFALAQLYQLLMILIFFILIISLKAAFNRDEIGVEDSALLRFFNAVSLIASMVLIVVLIISQISIYVRRLHDLDKSGFYYLLTLVPLVSLVLWVYLLFATGVKGPNKYGYPVSSTNFLVVLGFKKPKISNTNIKTT